MRCGSSTVKKYEIMHERARGHLLPHFETDMMDTAIMSAQGPVSLAVSISPKIWPMTVHIMHCFFMPHDMLELLVTLDWRQDGLGRALNGAAHGGTPEHDAGLRFWGPSKGRARFPDSMVISVLFCMHFFHAPQLFDQALQMGLSSSLRHARRRVSAESVEVGKDSFGRVSK